MLKTCAGTLDHQKSDFRPAAVLEAGFFFPLGYLDYIFNKFGYKYRSYLIEIYQVSC